MKIDENQTAMCVNRWCFAIPFVDMYARRSNSNDNECGSGFGISAINSLNISPLYTRDPQKKTMRIAMFSIQCFLSLSKVRKTCEIFKCNFMVLNFISQ